MNTKAGLKFFAIFLAISCIFFLDLFSENTVNKGNNPVRMEWNIDGVKREALVYIPTLAKTSPTPVIFAFHGHGGTMKLAASGNAFHKLWPEAISVYMQGLNTPGRLVDPEGKKSGWQAFAGDQNDRDLKFFDAVLNTLKTNYNIDEKRIYCTGHSNGGGFTYLLWEERGDLFAAFAPSAAVSLTAVILNKIPPKFAELAERLSKKAKQLTPKPVMHIAGENDQLVKFEWQKQTIDMLLKLNNCSEGKPWNEHCTIYPSKTGTPVVIYLHQKGHSLPSDARELIVKFFKEQVKP
ncbi:MAG TPA: prolyl oligopeptidase family serine peptidase [Victivallales bacterium]|nr:prolyl oligopeptidase family serine peptidase [Victivallales bacterium]HRR05833.1 prolyl oligopeptidase family serine peptidase [Victivallales bacterium]HRR28268.1 prolyl oligopeptidase family serine peptidase [Victivallales bacterium]HRU00377.1 prolyl oligopeptidase family serine peptidase [Victivallales bacterium]